MLPLTQRKMRGVRRTSPQVFVRCQTQNQTHKETHHGYCQKDGEESGSRRQEGCPQGRRQETGRQGRPGQEGRRRQEAGRQEARRQEEVILPPKRRLSKPSSTTAVSFGRRRFFVRAWSAMVCAKRARERGERGERAAKRTNATTREPSKQRRHACRRSRARFWHRRQECRRSLDSRFFGALSSARNRSAVSRRPCRRRRVRRTLRRWRFRRSFPQAARSARS